MILLLSIALLQPSADCHVDSAAVKAVRAVADGIIAADNARDITRVMGSYAADAWLLPPNDVPVRGHNGGRMISRTGAPPRLLNDAYLMTLRLEPDGRWRISHLIWHSEKK